MATNFEVKYKVSMSDEQAEKLKRYMYNASDFLWGVLTPDLNKQACISRVHQMLGGTHNLGFELKYYKSYQDNQEILVNNLTMKGVLERIIVPCVIKKITEPVLAELKKEYWNKLFYPPDEKWLIKHGLYNNSSEPVTTGYSFPGQKPETWSRQPMSFFIDISFLYEKGKSPTSWTRKWTPFFGIFMEEIAPYISRVDE